MSNIVFFSTLSMAKINPSNRTIDLSVEAELNKTSIGQLTLSVTPEDALLLKWSELEPSLAKILYPSALDSLKSDLDGVLISQQSLEAKGFSVAFDLSDFSLKMSAPLELIRPQSLSVKTDSARPKSDLPTDISGYFNLYSSYLYQRDEVEETTSEQLDLRSEMVMNWQGWVIENDNEYTSSSTSDESNIKRTGSRLVHDLPLDGARISIGDNYSFGSYFQSSTRMLGLSVTHDYSLVSDRATRPSASRSFTLTSPSSVEVLVDNLVVKRLNLAAGIYSLNDIPLNEGSNDITLRITDNVGVVTYVNFDVTTGLDLFAKGELEYELHVGVPAELQDQLEYQYDEPFISGYLNYGLRLSWTVGANAQADEFVQQVGLKNIYASPIGQIAFENAFSASDENGQAYRLVYSTFTDNSPAHQDFSLGYEYSTRNFRQLGYRPDTDEDTANTEHQIQANYSFFITPTLQTSLSTNFSKDYNQEDFNKSLGITFSKDLAKGQFRYSVGGQWEETQGERDWSVSLSFSYRLSNQRKVKLSHQSDTDKTRLEFTQENDQRYVGALNVRAGVEKNEDDEAALDLTTLYNGNRFTASFDQASYYDQLNAQSAQHQSRLSLSTSVAFAGSQWAVGKTINDSFAVVDAHPTLGDRTIELGSYDDEYRASNKDFDSILVSDLNSYSHSSITVDVHDLAPGYDIGSGVLSFYPSYRSGYGLVVGTEANISVIATLLNDKKEPLALQVGTAICTTDSSKKENTFFTNRSGRFAITGLKPCLYEVTLKDEKQSTFNIDVKKGEQLQRIGEIYVH
ncbi:MAG: fimbria/pilus outer membrane usher protein [Marinomonas sp.]|uniref:fimbria/pilus outer membrane usher protein n=1 Tax=Marinomonas sp. TaxID=1904862 RepID=UPI003C779130